jgi:hypothetical protein
VGTVRDAMDGKMKRRNFIKGLFALPVTLAVVDATIAAKAFFEPKPDYAKLVEKQAPITEWQPNTAYNFGDRIVSSTGKVWTVSGAGVSGNTEVPCYDCAHGLCDGTMFLNPRG